MGFRGGEDRLPLAGRLRNVTAATKALEIRRLPCVATAIQRNTVIDFESPGPSTRATPPAIAIEDLPADASPALPREPPVMPTHATPM